MTVRFINLFQIWPKFNFLVDDETKKFAQIVIRFIWNFIYRTSLYIGYNNLFKGMLTTLLINDVLFDFRWFLFFKASHW